jgi:hypothetical protein
VIRQEASSAAEITGEAVVRAFILSEAVDAVAVAPEGASFLRDFDVAGAFAVVEILDGQIRSFVTIRPEAATTLSVALEAASVVALPPDAEGEAAVGPDGRSAVTIRSEGRTIIIWPVPCDQEE